MSVGPKPKQFSQIGAQPGQRVTVQEFGTDPDLSAPAYTYHSREYLNEGVFGQASDDELVRGDTLFPDFDTTFDALDILESFNTGQSLSVSYQGKLRLIQSKIKSIAVNIIGDDASSPTNPPQFRLRIYAESAASANPIYDSGTMDAPGSYTEYTVEENQLSEQPTSGDSFHFVVTATLDADQSIKCSRPFSIQE